MNSKIEYGKHYELEYRKRHIDITPRLCRSPSGADMYVADVRVSTDHPECDRRNWMNVDAAIFHAFQHIGHAFTEGLTRGCAFIDALEESLQAS
jgi:hypothetical protein